MKRLAVAVATSAAIFSAGAFAADNGERALDISAVAPNQGQVLCTAAVNSTGTLAGGVNATSATLLTTGEYQVVFGGPCGADVRAISGWARWVQVDTLTTGSIADVSCTTADRLGVINGIWVECTNSAGTLVNTSFFLAVAR